MCLHLGLHRGATWRDESPTARNQNAWLFWNVYVLDKGLSLRLGRPSVIQDYDITVPIPTSSIDRHPAIEHCLLTWIKVSRCQGRVYELLYSPAALAQDDGIRTARAQGLADDLLSIMKEKKKIEVCVSFCRDSRAWLIRCTTRNKTCRRGQRPSRWKTYSTSPTRTRCCTTRSSR